MTPTDPRREALEAAIAAQEEHRAALGDAIADTTIAALRSQLAALPAVVRQRKQATVLFVDVVDSTKLMVGRDPEEKLAVMDSALAELGGLVTEHGGRIVKFTGDGLMAVFGLPIARENDPEMAVRTGLAIVGDARNLAARLEADHGVHGFEVRVGINTGLVASGGSTEADDTVIGDAVNLAARLESAAAPGTVLISRDTLRHVRNDFDVEPEGAIEAKGFPDAIDVYRVVRRSERGEEAAVRTIEGVTIPMIGREAELGTLLDAASAAASRAPVRAITIHGDAGLGKSRLLNELRSALRHRPHVELVARATLESETLAYSLIRDLLERRFGILVDDSGDLARTKLVAGLTKDLDDDAEGELKAHFIGQLIGLDFADSPHIAPSLAEPQQILNRAVMYLKELIGALAQGTPVVVLIEDLQWADAASLDVLESLIAELDVGGVLLVGTARPELAERRPTWGRDPRHETIRLQRLTDAEAEKLARTALVKMHDPPELLVGRLVEQTAGNPYYIEEMIRMLIDAGTIVVDGASWTIDADRYDETRIPSTLTGVLQARLEGLDASDRTTLQQASVVGRIFWEALLSYLASSGEASAEVTSGIGALGARGMIHERLTSTFSNTTEYAFTHEILRAVAYEGVLLDARRQYHSMVADWLIANTGDRATELAGLIASHLERADRHSEAIDQLAEAAAAALSSYAIEMADTYFERALELVFEDDPRRFSLLLGREHTLSLRGDRVEQEAVLDLLASLATEPGDRAEIGIRRAWMLYYLGDYAAVTEIARGAATNASLAGDQVREAHARRAVAAAGLAADLPAPIGEAERAVAISRESGDLPTQAATLNVLGLAAHKAGDYAAARQYLLEVLELSQRLGLIGRELTALSNLGVIESSVGDFDRAGEYFDLSGERAAGTGDRVNVGHALVNRSWAAVSRADWRSGRDLALDAIGITRELGHRDAEAEGWTWLGHAYLGLEDIDAAHDAYARALEIREQLGQAALAMGARAGLARALLAAGHLDQAAAQAGVIADFLDGGGSLAAAWEEYKVRLTAIEVLRAAGDERHSRLLATAHEQLSEAASHINDPRDRRNFLDIPWHRRISELAGDRAGD